MGEENCWVEGVKEGEEEEEGRGKTMASRERRRKRGDEKIRKLLGGRDEGWKGKEWQKMRRGEGSGRDDRG